MCDSLMLLEVAANKSLFQPKLTRTQRHEVREERIGLAPVFVRLWRQDPDAIVVEAKTCEERKEREVVTPTRHRRSRGHGQGCGPRTRQQARRKSMDMDYDHDNDNDTNSRPSPKKKKKPKKRKKRYGKARRQHYSSDDDGTWFQIAGIRDYRNGYWLVRWTGYDSTDDDTWEPRTSFLRGCTVFADFEANRKAKKKQQQLKQQQQQQQQL